MAIIKVLPTTSGLTYTYHRIESLEVDLITKSITVIQSSWFDRESFIRSDKPKKTSFGIPIISDLNDIEIELVTSTLSPLVGGKVVNELDSTLDTSKYHKLEELQGAYSKELASSITYRNKEIQPDLDSITNAIILVGEESIFIPWVCKDNTTLLVCLSDLLEMRRIILYKNSKLFAKLQSLKTTVREALTLKQISDTSWGDK